MSAADNDSSDAPAPMLKQLTPVLIVDAVEPFHPHRRLLRHHIVVFGRA